MQEFNYYNPTRIVFGQNRLRELHELVPLHARVMLTYGTRSAQQTGLIQQVKTCLSSREVIEFGGIESNPDYETLSEGVQTARRQNIDFLLAVGGGSVMDATKFIALATKDHTGGLYNILYHGLSPVPQDDAIPLGCIATLPASGSEMNNIGVIAYKGHKWFFTSPLIFPQFSFLDPNITSSAPKEQLANGIVNAFVQVIEQYLTTPEKAKLQDRMAESLLQTLIEEGLQSYHDPTDLDARKNFMWSAATALNGYIGVGVKHDWSTHLIAHEITALFGIAHGRSLAAVLPHLLRERKRHKHDKLVQFAERVWHINHGSDSDKIHAAIAKTEAFFQSLNVPTNLHAYGVTQADIARIIDNMASIGLRNLSESGDLTLDIVEKILRTALLAKAA